MKNLSFSLHRVLTKP